MLLDNSKLNSGLNPNNELCNKWESPQSLCSHDYFSYPAKKSTGASYSYVWKLPQITSHKLVRGMGISRLYSKLKWFSKRNSLVPLVCFTVLLPLAVPRMPAPWALTFCPCQDTSSQPPRTCWSRQPLPPASWPRSAGGPGASQTWCPGSLCSAQTLALPCANPVSGEPLQPAGAFRKKESEKSANSW